MTDLLYSDVEEDLRSSVRSLLEDRSPGRTYSARPRRRPPTTSRCGERSPSTWDWPRCSSRSRFGGAGASARKPPSC